MKGTPEIKDKDLADQITENLFRALKNFDHPSCALEYVPAHSPTFTLTTLGNYPGATPLV